MVGKDKLGVQTRFQTHSIKFCWALLQWWGDFAIGTVRLIRLGELNAAAVLGCNNEGDEKEAMGASGFSFGFWIFSFQAVDVDQGEGESQVGVRDLQKRLKG